MRRPLIFRSHLRHVAPCRRADAASFADLMRALPNHTVELSRQALTAAAAPPLLVGDVTGCKSLSADSDSSPPPRETTAQRSQRSQRSYVSCRMASAAPTLKLMYFAIHGMAARVRLAARVGGVALDDYRFESREEFMALKTSGELPFGQVPLLVVDGTTKIPQSGAILRFVCKKGGLHPADDLQAAAVDAALDQETDCFASYVAAKCGPRARMLMSATPLPRFARLSLGADAPWQVPRALWLRVGG